MSSDTFRQDPVHPPLQVGIIGAGVAGLYAAMLLRDQGHEVHLFEATNRVGGRVYTHRFTSGSNQYYEAGAMRIPCSSSQKPFFDLVEKLNSRPTTNPIALIPYILESEANRFHINGVLGVYKEIGSSGAGGLRQKDVNWGFDPGFDPRTVKELLDEAIKPLIQITCNGQPGPPCWTEEGFWKLVEKYDNLSFRQYLLKDCQWSDSIIDFVETVTSQSNRFSLSVVEYVMKHFDFGATLEWVTIKDGMDRLPLGMEEYIGRERITFHATVTGIEECENGSLLVKAFGETCTVERRFHKVIIAIPPAALRLIPAPQRPAWPLDKEIAIRSMHFEAIWKMGMRFKERFWETMVPEGGLPEKGGQSVTDLPIRLVVLPSYGIGEKGPGVLLLYALLTDAQAWLPPSAVARRALAIQCLDQVYPHVQGVEKLLIETADVTWASSSAIGDASFLPGQWATRFLPGCRPEKHIHFAGEHLSYNHTWIVGAIQSASRVVREILSSKLQPSSEDDFSWYKYLPTSPYDPKTGGMPREKLPDVPHDLGGQPDSRHFGPKVAYIPGPAS
ncbi:hypothetical protein FRC08_010283 [Ceratobasidium sp. 394]|nr:hypothetical protein FRC08_010283 [Ceratobasidium sp. 394]KAG9088580.1 hypothetical protein FS749_002048 [Ceratobasidium sp. UAMH 11750]